MANVNLPRVGNAPLVFPAGRLPKFNQGHVAASGCRLAAVPIGNTFFDLVTGKAGTANSSPTTAMSGWIGPSVNFTSSSTMNVSFGGMSTANDTLVTIACIIVLNASGVFESYVSTSGTNTGWRLGLDQNNSFGMEIIQGGVAVILSNTTLTANVPYFLAASTTGAAANFVIKRLDNGALISAQTAYGSSPSAPNGTYLIGNGNSTGAQSNIAAAMIGTGSFLTPTQLVQWSTDPWSLWYPGLAVDVFHGTFSAASAVRFRKTLSQIGGRVGARQPQGWAN